MRAKLLKNRTPKPKFKPAPPQSNLSVAQILKQATKRHERQFGKFK